MYHLRLTVSKAMLVNSFRSLKQSMYFEWTVLLAPIVFFLV